MLVLDLCQLHYRNMLITCLELSPAKYEKMPWKEKKLTCKFAGPQDNRLIYKCRECRENGMSQ